VPPSTPSQDSSADAFVHAATILREVAAADHLVDPYIGRALAGLVEAVGRRIAEVPPEVSRSALSVVSAVDRATGHRR
jgi:hypothetical protein